MDSLALSTPKGNFGVCKNCKKSGVTLVELVVVVGIILTMSVISYGIMLGLEFRTDTQTSIDKLSAQLKSQRIKAMMGASYEGASSSGTAIYFHLGTNKYTHYNCPPPPKNCLFDETNATNFQEELEENVSFSETTLSNNTIFFEQNSGEMKNFSTTSDNTLTVVNAADGSKYLFTFSKTGNTNIKKI